MARDYNSFDFGLRAVTERRWGLKIRNIRSNQVSMRLEVTAFTCSMHRSVSSTTTFLLNCVLLPPWAISDVAKKISREANIGMTESDIMENNTMELVLVLVPILSTSHINRIW